MGPAGINIVKCRGAAGVEGLVHRVAGQQVGEQMGGECLRGGIEDGVFDVYGHDVCHAGIQ